MEPINAPEAGPAAYAAYRDASLSQLEGFMAEATALSAERMSLGKSASDKKRRDAIDENLADIRGNSDALRLCLDIEKDLRARRAEKATHKAMKAEHEAAKQQQQQQHPHSSLNLSGAGVRGLPCTPPAPLMSAKGGGSRKPAEHEATKTAFTYCFFQPLFENLVWRY